MILISVLLIVWGGNEPKVGFGEPISVSDWEIVEDSQRGIYDAVLIEDVTIFKFNSINFYRRIRILSESGKAAAEYFAPSGKVKDLKGRVVDRSGREITFDKKEDFVKVLVFKTRGDRQKSRVLVPPGLTRDAVVEFQWKVDAIEGLEVTSWQDFYLIQGPFHVAEKRFEILPKALGSTDGYFVTRFLSTPLKRPAVYTATKSRGRDVIVYRHVPPLMSYPFGNRLLDQNTAYVMMYKSLSGYPDEPSAFWKKFSKTWLKEYYSENLKSSKAYKSWLEEVKAEMPEPSDDALIHVYKAFRKKVKTPDLLSPSQLARIDEHNEDSDSSLRRAMDEGHAQYSDLGRIFYRILKDLDIECYMIFANSFDGMLFFPKHLRPFGLPLISPFFGVRKGKGVWVTVSPFYQEYSPGYIPPKFQGTQALAVNPFDKWTHTFIRLPRFGPKEHQRVTQYKTEIENNGKMTCLLKRQLSGHFNAMAKRSYLPKSPQDRASFLREKWERRLPNMEITSVSLEGGDALKGNVVTKIALAGQANVKDAYLLVFTPFPGQLTPLRSPSFWPSNRTQPIILNHCLNQVDLNQVTLPEGWQLVGDPSWKKSNGVGEVSFTALQKGREITVRRDIKIVNDLFQANQEQDLKNFIAWMTEAMNQRLGISKGANHE